jgi:hypothetical protein
MNDRVIERELSEKDSKFMKLTVCAHLILHSFSHESIRTPVKDMHNHFIATDERSWQQLPECPKGVLNH